MAARERWCEQGGERTWGECDSCRYGTWVRPFTDRVLGWGLHPYHEFGGMYERPRQLCYVCASTPIGEQTVKEITQRDTALYQTIGYCTNLILSRVDHLNDPPTEQAVRP